MEQEKVVRGVALFAVMAVISIVILSLLSLIIRYFEKGALISLFAAIVPVLMFANFLYEKVTPFEEPDDTQSYKEEPIRRPNQGPQPLSPEPEIDTETRVQNIKKSPEWYQGGRGNYPNYLSGLIRTLRRVVKYLPLSDSRTKQGTYYVERIAFGIGVISTVWVLLLFIVSMGEITELPGVLTPIVAAFPSNYPFIPNVVPAVLFIGGLLWYSISKDEATCPSCGTSFSLKSHGRYYKNDGKHQRTETKDDKTYTYYEIDGKRILECTNEECGKYFINDTHWTDK